MKILFDHQIFCFLYGGASKYFAMLMNAMPEGVWETTSLFAMNEYAREKNLMPTYRKMFKGQSLIADYINRPYTNYRIKSGKFDVFHQTNFGIYCLKNLKDKPLVTTYHDSNLSTFDPHPEIVEQQRKSIERANAVICVSNNTKNDLLQLFDVDDAKVHVIYHGIEIPDISHLLYDRIIASPYILYVGRRSEYKNFKMMAKGFALLHEKYHDIILVCTSASFSNEEQRMFHELGIADCVVNVNANEDDMKRLYRDALFFVFPSIYEGFGMPILEAWSCSCPTVLASASCFPEIAQEAAVYFDPNSVDSMLAAMLRMLEDENLRLSMIAKGNERLKEFSWDKCAEEHMKIYSSLI